MQLVPGIPVTGSLFLLPIPFLTYENAFWVLCKSTCNEIKSLSFSQLFVSGSWSFTVLCWWDRLIKMCEFKENMRQTSAKPEMPLGIMEALWERPCDFCHWSLSEAEPATSHSQKASWVRNLAELLVQFWSLKLRGCECCWKQSSPSHCCSSRTAAVYCDGWRTGRGLGGKLGRWDLLAWTVLWGKPVPVAAP